MGDISAEPSMEEILSSIKRIIAEEGDAATGTRTRRAPKAAPAPLQAVPEGDEVLELSEPVAEEKREPMPIGPAEPARKADPILSDRAAEATRGPLETLSRLVIKPETPGSDTLEGLVRDLLKPMLSDWLDENLPRIVETMVAREIARITGRQG
ncbi:MAG: DUF2497 domain-containing protein [Sphingomonas sp.]